MGINQYLKNFYNQVLLRIWEKNKSKKLLGAFILCSIIILILFSNFSSRQIMLKPDEVAKRNILSDITATIVDEKKTAELREQAAAQVQKVYQEDKNALSVSRSNLSAYYNNISKIIESDADNKVTDLEGLLDRALQGGRIETNISLQYLAQYLANTTPEDLQEMRLASLSVLQKVMEKPITIEAIDGVYTQAEELINNYAYVTEAKEVMRILLLDLIQPNLLFNQEATAQAIKEARDSVQAVQITIKAGEMIVREGERVSSEQISILEQLGIQRTQSYPLALIGTVIFILLSFWLISEFLRRYNRDIYNNDMLMLLIGIIFILILLISRAITVIEISNRPEINALIGYLAPVAAGSMLLAILLDNRLAYFMTAIMAIFVALLSNGNQLFVAITSFIGGTVGVYRVTRLSQASDLAKSGLYIALANIISLISLFLMGENITPNIIAIAVLFGAINGIVSAVLTIGALPYLESAFNLTSMIKLLELSNPNQELLKRLLMNAPGTYHHSLMVGNLAEAAAESVDANPLLVRVGAYYHDIGKVKRPDYFVENQRFDNPHEKIAPALSALIVTSHVKEGAELARERNLPQAIIDFIEQHHGSSLAKYFYSRALEEDPDGHINEENFRYEGPKPQNKEVALVMLADSVEAAVRSLKDPSAQSIKEMVKKIIDDKLNDRQLEECDLTFKDLDVISYTFSKVLESIYHKRIEYPELIVREFEQRRESNGNNDNQSAK